MDPVNANDFSINQLRNWCSAFNLATHGSKSTLAARLSEVHFRGKCPSMPNETCSNKKRQPNLNESANAENVSELDNKSNEKANAQNIPETDEKANEATLNEREEKANEAAINEREEEPNEATMSERGEEPNEMANDGEEESNEMANYDEGGESEEDANDEPNEEHKEADVNEGQGKAELKRAAKNEQKNLEKSEEMQDNEENAKDGKQLYFLNDIQQKLAIENAFQKEKLKLMARELELMNFERELLRRENDLLRASERVSERETSCKVTKDDEIPFQSIKEMLPDFDGHTNVSVWRTHINVLKMTYGLTENKLRSLIFSKVKGDAQAWVYSKPELANEKVDTLSASMEKAFLPKESAITLRKKLEARKWQTNESFTSYFNTKVTLSNGLEMPECELIDYIIHGISDRQIRTSANMMCFKEKDALLSALQHVNLVAPRSGGATNNSGKIEKPVFRCYNCNCLGHIASDCRKPKREVGACFVCGKMGHLAAACEENKKTSSPATRRDDYNAS
ncbi:repetitive organellar protein-like [Drosophila kikkawai]|uniref:Repetitive organellar protein-like n=1 Tax=Drosophila kikkawai TaxID=30033 RepID=A0A6P4IJF0_DROKI